MKSSKSTGIYRPFKNLNTLIKKRAVALRPNSSAASDMHTESESGDSPDSELNLFKEAMTGVRKISRDNCVERRRGAHKQLRSQTDSEAEIILKLHELVKNGRGFVVADTPEYIEGRGGDTHPEITRRLHHGDFAVQGHIDLHGLNVENAHQAFADFLRQSIANNKRVVLIIHGRGLSSPAEPILKTNVCRWLSSGPWNKWVMAFASARWCDGGAGATYVLLRQRPITKRIRKKWTSLEDLKQ
jgi:DNA-nicking Smr family endonuclease